MYIILYNKLNTSLLKIRRIVFNENYLLDLPRDIQEMIIDISNHRYCDIYISFWNNYRYTKYCFISKRMDRIILKYSKTIKNVKIDSEQYVNIESYASSILKSYITGLVSNFKKRQLEKFYMTMIYMIQK